MSKASRVPAPSTLPSAMPTPTESRAGSPEGLVGASVKATGSQQSLMLSFDDIADLPPVTLTTVVNNSDNKSSATVGSSSQQQPSRRERDRLVPQIGYLTFKIGTARIVAKVGDKLYILAQLIAAGDKSRAEDSRVLFGALTLHPTGVDAAQPRVDAHLCVWNGAKPHAPAVTVFTPWKAKSGKFRGIIATKNATDYGKIGGLAVDGYFTFEGPTEQEDAQELATQDLVMSAPLPWVQLAWRAAMHRSIYNAARADLFPLSTSSWSWSSESVTFNAKVLQSSGRAGWTGNRVGVLLELSGGPFGPTQLTAAKAQFQASVVDANLRGIGASFAASVAALEPPVIHLWITGFITSQDDPLPGELCEYKYGTTMQIELPIFGVTLCERPDSKYMKPSYGGTHFAVTLQHDVAWGAIKKWAVTPPAGRVLPDPPSVPAVPIGGRISAL
jgi:hypothetical protein